MQNDHKEIEDNGHQEIEVPKGTPSGRGGLGFEEGDC
jgi:hypothetical protein